MTEEGSGDSGQLNGFPRRGLGLLRSLTAFWRRFTAQGASWGSRSRSAWSAAWRTLCPRLLIWLAMGLSAAHDCLTLERGARFLALLKKWANRYPWGLWVKQAVARLRRAWPLAGYQLRARIGWLQHKAAGSRLLSFLSGQWDRLVGGIAQSRRINWAIGFYLRLRRWCRHLAQNAAGLTSAWPSTGDITNKPNSAGPTDRSAQESAVWVDSESPLGIARQIWSTKAQDAYFSARGIASWSNTLWADGDCPLGYARIIVEYLPPEEPEVAEFQPDNFLFELFQAYSQLLEQRGDASLKLAPVVPLMDIFALMSSVIAVKPNYSPIIASEYSKENFIGDVYRLHVSGVNTTLDVCQN